MELKHWKKLHGVGQGLSHLSEEFLLPKEGEGKPEALRTPRI